MSPQSPGSRTDVPPVEIDRKTLETLVCPLTKTRLVYDREAGELVSVAARLAYPIRHNIPLLVLDEARQLTEEELARLAR